MGESQKSTQLLRRKDQGVQSHLQALVLDNAGQLKRRLIGSQERLDVPDVRQGHQELRGEVGGVEVYECVCWA